MGSSTGIEAIPTREIYQATSETMLRKPIRTHFFCDVQTKFQSYVFDMTMFSNNFLKITLYICSLYIFAAPS